MKFNALAAGLLAATFLTGAAANAAQLGIVFGSTGGDIAFLRAELDKFEQQTGNKVTLKPVAANQVAAQIKDGAFDALVTDEPGGAIEAAVRHRGSVSRRDLPTKAVGSWLSRAAGWPIVAA